MAASGAEFFTMNEVNRLGIIQHVHDQTLLQRVLRRYREHGAASPASALSYRRSAGHSRLALFKGLLLVML